MADVPGTVPSPFTFFSPRAAGASYVPPPPSLQRNAQGGVLITEGDVDEALAVLGGPGAAPGGAVPAARLAEALRFFQPSLTKEELAKMLGGAPALTAREATNILVDNGLHLFDPLAEAHRALSGGSGELSQAALNRACEALGQQPFSELEWRTLLESCGQGKAGQAGALTVEAARGAVARDRERREAARGGAGGGAAAARLR
jgi:hypothetical protein